MTLEELHGELTALVARINDDEQVPDRYTLNGPGDLADMDASALRVAASVVHRLMLWEKFPTVSPESYFAAADHHSVRVESES